jgi:hypothetical protein
MNHLELNAKKAELIRSILNEIDNEETLNEITATVQRLLKKVPCQYSAEELKERALLAIEEMKQGKGISHEEMKNRFSA